MLETRLKGRYLIGDELGFGGMAVVYRAENIELGRPVALKVLRPDRILDPDIALRFRTEALAIARLAHPHIVAIHARGEDPDLMWFEMDYIEGGTLADVLARGDTAWPRTLRLVGQAASALAYAHSMGVVHRDIKPSNLMVTASGDHLIVTDFGIAKILGRTTMTETGTTLGTVAYMSPEQLMAQEVTGTTDQYALGVVAFEALTGQTPFNADTAGPATLERLRGAIPPLRSLRPELPEDLETLIARMLAPNPSERWPDLKVVQRIAEEIAISGRSSHVHSTGVKRRAPRRRGVLALGAAAILLGGAVIYGATKVENPLAAAPDSTQRIQTSSTVDTDTSSLPLGLADTGSTQPAPEAAPLNNATPPDRGGPRSDQDDRPRRADTPRPTGSVARQESTPATPDTSVVPDLPTTGTLQIASRLPGTFLYINGSASPHLLTERFQSITVPAGSVTMVLRSSQPGCSPREDRLVIEPGEVRRLHRTANCPDE